MARAVTTEPAQVAAPKPVRQVLLDMVRSLGLMAVIVGVSLIFVPNLIHPGKSSKVQSADYSDAVVGYRQVTGADPLTPTGLASGWYANASALAHSARVAHLHIGWVTPDKKYAALDESNGPALPFIVGVLGARAARASGTVVIDGTSWATRVSTRGEQSLTATLGSVTVVITGSASLPQQRSLAAALRPDRARIS
jgi:hypothetical protein